jgi:hypothetical protein
MAMLPTRTPPTPCDTGRKPVPPSRFDRSARGSSFWLRSGSPTLFPLTVRPTPAFATKLEVYRALMARKGWHKRGPKRFHCVVPRQGGRRCRAREPHLPLFAGAPRVSGTPMNHCAGDVPPPTPTTPRSPRPLGLRRPNRVPLAIRPSDQPSSGRATCGQLPSPGQDGEQLDRAAPHQPVVRGACARVEIGGQRQEMERLRQLEHTAAGGDLL